MRSDDMLLVILSASLLFLTACEARNTGTGTLPSASDHTIQIDVPGGMSIDPLLPPGAGDRPILPGESGRQRTAEGLPILDSKGPNLKQLFREDIKDPIERIKRIENAVLEMRQDLDSVLPAINRLVSVEGDIQALTTQLQGLLTDENGSMSAMGQSENNDSSSSSVVENEPLSVVSGQERNVGSVHSNGRDDHSNILVSSGNVALPEHVKAENNDTDINDVLSSLSNDAIDIKSIRLGEHSDKVRIVIDSPVDIKFTTDLDPQEHILVVDLPGVRIKPTNQEIVSNLFITSISLNASQENESGGQVIFELKKNVEIKRATMMPPSRDQKQYRLLIDLGE